MRARASSTPSSTSPPSPTASCRSRPGRCSTTTTGSAASTSVAAAPTGPTTAAAGPTRRPASGCGCCTSPITRAKSQVVCWWAPTKNAVASPLHRMLMRDAGATDVPESPRVPTDDEVVALFAEWRDRGGPSPEPAIHADPGRRPAAAGPARARRPTLHPRGRRRVASHVLLRAEQGRGGDRLGPACRRVASEPEVSAKDDEEIADRPPTVDRRRSSRRDRSCRHRWLSCPSVRRSARWCTPCSSTPTRRRPTCAPSCSRHIDEQLGWWPVELDREELADALVAVCDSPLGPLAGATLREIPLRRPAARDGLRAAAGRWRRPRAGARRHASATWRRCCAATCPRATRSRRTPTRW